MDEAEKQRRIAEMEEWNRKSLAWQEKQRALDSFVDSLLVGLSPEHDREILYVVKLPDGGYMTKVVKPDAPNRHKLSYELTQKYGQSNVRIRTIGLKRPTEPFNYFEWKGKLR